MSDFFLVDPLQPASTPGTQLGLEPPTELPGRRGPQGTGLAGRVASVLDTTSGVTGLTQNVPSTLARATGVGGRTRAPRVDPAYDRNLTALQNKYTEMAPVFASLPEQVRNAIINLDSQRVAQGQAPLTRDQTTAAIQTATTDEQATPQAERNPLDVLGNFRKDASTILKSIPRLPLAMLNELRELPSFGDRVLEAQRQGANPIEALATAPGIRLIPGSYTVGNLAGGAEGIREAITHPLMTGLDVLPVAAGAAGSTKVGKLAREASDAAGKRPRPLSAVLTNKVGVDEAGNPTLVRNNLGQTKDFVQNETRAGQLVDSLWGRTNRNVMRMLGGRQARYRALLTGAGVADNELEAFMPRIAQTFDRHAETTPLLRAQGPEGEAFRAQFKADIERGANLDRYSPDLVADYRGIVDDLGKYAVNNEILGRFDGELYPAPIARDLQTRQARLRGREFRVAARNEYVNPSGTLGVDQLKAMSADALDSPLARDRYRNAQAAAHVLDAYGIDVKGSGIQSAITAAGYAGKRGDWSAVRTAFDNVLDSLDPAAPLTPRRGFDEVIKSLRRVNRNDKQATRLEYALARGERGEVTKALQNLYERKPPKFSDEEWVNFREDVVSLSRRMSFDERIGGAGLAKRIERDAAGLDRMTKANPPARFDALLADEITGRLTTSARSARELSLGRPLTPDEAGEVALAVTERRFDSAFPEMDPVERSAMLRGVENDVKATWQMLRDAGHDPMFVHKVSAQRTNAALTGSIGPVPIKPSQGKERALDLTPGVNDVQVALTHQAGELLAERYREQFANEMIEAVGKTEDQLRAEMADTVRWRQQMNPSLSFDGHFDAMLRRGWERFNPETAGHAWGGVKLNKYLQENSIYIPKSVAENLHRLAKPPSIVSSAIDPFTKMFRYNVIGLSAGVIVNNFFSNSVAMMAEVGPRPLKYMSEAKKWLDDPSKIPNEELKAMVLAEHPAMAVNETLDRSAWLKSRNGQRFIMSRNAGQAFMDSFIARGAKAGKNALDSVAEGSMRFQVMGDNLYRGMIYLDELDKGIRKGKSQAAAERAALDQVQRVLIDYNSFTPLERSAIRTVIPFYSYMGHAMRYVSRYPLDHPLRASIASKLAAAEKERLGALPEQFLGSIPIGKPDENGNQRMVPLAPFSPFGDISNMFSLAGWLSATNPVVTSVLESIGVQRGETDAYPNLRYDPETGRMKPVTGSFLTNLFNNTVPRAGLVTAALGLNPQYNAIREQDPGKSGRFLLSAAGLPRLWLTDNLTQQRVKAEVSRQRDASSVKNDAMRSGDWSEALRYPSLRGYYDAITTAPPGSLALHQPATRTAIADQLRVLVGEAG